jgi:hypothetical protein
VLLPVEERDLIHDTVRFSWHVLGREPGQFVQQMAGRLLPRCDRAAILEFTDSLASLAWR